MRLIRRIARRFRDDEKGVSLPLVAGMFVVLLGFSAFAIDLGWLYLNGTRLQRAADSSALAGVVFLPADVANVSAKAVDGANANGWDIGTVNGNPTGSGGPDDLTWAQLADNKLEVTLQTTVGTFFLKALGFDQFSLTRKATAEYIKPVPLGSPANCIGIGQAVTSTGLLSSATASFNACNAFTQNFWGAIQGRATDLHHGDPYATNCGYNCSGSNPDYRPNYYHAIEVPAGKNWVDVYLYDAGFYDRSGFAETGDEESLANSNSGGTNMTFNLYMPDSTPLIPDDNSVAVTCSSGSSTLTINSGASSGTYMNRWARMCRINNPVAGIYVLRTQNGGNSLGGTNQYSILASTNNIASGTPPRVYAINSMSIFTNAPSGQATVYIAEVDPVHAGKTLELVFYDPGEGAGNAQMTVLPPPGVTGYSCSWIATDVTSNSNATSGSSCTIDTTISGTAQFNGEWITMEIDIPSGYTCSSDCFWKMDLDLNTSHDRTTWEARVIGNPVRLVPNP